ncbi:MAG: heptosyltransferase [Desulfovibrionales bacterium]|nr:heptosyltransferase [Desulfovibrionales bacterium]
MKKFCVIQRGDLTALLQTKRLLLSLQRQQTDITLCVTPATAQAAKAVYPNVRVECIYDADVPSADIPDPLVRNVTLFETLQAASFDAVYVLPAGEGYTECSSLFPSGNVHGVWKSTGHTLQSEWLTLLGRVTKRSVFLNKMDAWAHLVDSPVPSHVVNPIAMRKGGGIGVVLRDSDGRTVPVAILAGCIRAVSTATRASSITLFGDAADAVYADELRAVLEDSVKASVESMCYETTFEDDAAAIGVLDMLVTPESPYMHLAAHLGVPVNAFFYSSKWCMEQGPYGLGHRVWQVDIPCAPCASKECTEQFACMDVFGGEQFQRFLGGKIDDQYPEGVTGYVSMLDEVGVTYMPVFGEEEHAHERLQLRGLAAEYLGITTCSHGVSEEAAAMWYRSGDWLCADAACDGEGDDA